MLEDVFKFTSLQIEMKKKHQGFLYSEFKQR